MDWAQASWITYEKLEDSMKVVPAVHGWGNKLGNKCLNNPIVPMFRKEFTVNAEVRHATLYICGLGHYEASINGQKTGDGFLTPGWTLYQKRQLYNTYEVTDLLHQGENVIGILVGNGFFYISRKRYRKMVVAYGYPRFIFQLIIKYNDGTMERIVSDKNCRVAPSPVIFSSIYGGEDYDARREQEGWNAPGFDDSAWANPVLLDDSYRNLVQERNFPMKIMDEFKPIRIITSETGRLIYDFGQNASGIIYLKVRGYKGTTIKIRPGELLDGKNDVLQKSGRGPYELNYILNGEDIEEWQPKFTYYGFRYADIEIIEPPQSQGETEILELKMLHTRNSAPSTGRFQCSDTLMNEIFELINWAIKSNMASILTDCPHREKLGWLEQSYLMGPSIHYNFDIHTLYRKIIMDMMDSQLTNGLVPNIAPEYVKFEEDYRDSPEWGSACVILPWQVYRWYSDREILEMAYPMIRRYLAYLESKAENNILDYGLGDWYDLGPGAPEKAQLTPPAVTATAIYYYDLKIAAEIAERLDYRKDARYYLDLSNRVGKAFRDRFYDHVSGICSTGSQTAYSISLYTGLIPESDRPKVLNNLIRTIVENDYSLTTGDVGHYFLVHTLSENGRSDILYRIHSGSDGPGYAYQLKQGATSLTEHWAALPYLSQNHIILGHLMEWFYSVLGGIRQDKNSVGYNEFVIAPKPVMNINWVKCSFQSPKGKIISEWEISDDRFSLYLSVPEGSKARIILPGKYTAPGCVISELPGQKKMKFNPKRGDLHLTTGEYLIESQKK